MCEVGKNDWNVYYVMWVIMCSCFFNWFMLFVDLRWYLNVWIFEILWFVSYYCGN